MAIKGSCRKWENSECIENREEMVYLIKRGLLPRFSLLFLNLLCLFTQLSGGSKRSSTEITRCCNEDPAYRPISIRRVYVQTNTPAFHSPLVVFRAPPWSDKADLFAWVQRLVWGGGIELGREINSAKADSVCRGVVCICIQVNVSWLKSIDLWEEKKTMAILFIQCK